MIDKLKELWQLKSKMEEIKKELDAVAMEIKSPDGLVKITINGSQDIKEVFISEKAEPAVLAASFKEAANRAIKESQKIAAQKMSVLAGMNLPGA